MNIFDMLTCEQQGNPKIGAIALTIAVLFTLYWAQTFLSGLYALYDDGYRTKAVVTSSPYFAPSRFGSARAVDVEFVGAGDERQSTYIKRPAGEISDYPVGRSMPVWFLPDDPGVFVVGSKGLKDQLAKGLLLLALALSFGVFAGRSYYRSV